MHILAHHFRINNVTIFGNGLKLEQEIMQLEAKQDKTVVEHVHLLHTKSCI
jgi:hypothetical protein